ncbi:hypothetical protein [Novosphingobium sp.]|uniref:hypothetical protein n=1 Tax=Novosphingobium sp. TaxID=1874826 RepID=UPI00262D199E|nr:hypothetical protein [Novosphingobium sp.]
MEDELNPTEPATLREKVDAARNRLVERTSAAKPVQTVKGLIEEHPVASVAAGILLGALIAKALPSISRTSSGKADVSTGNLRKSAAGLASVAGKLALDYATRAREAGREGLHKAEEVGSTVSEKLADGSDEARRKAIDFAEIARTAILEASEAALQKVSEIASRKKG